MVPRDTDLCTPLATLIDDKQLIIVMVIATNLCHLRVVQPNRTMPNCTLMAIFAEAKAQPFGEVVGADATVHTNQHSSLGLRATRTRQVFGGGF